jgi:hypothetical protein
MFLFCQTENIDPFIWSSLTYICTRAEFYVKLVFWLFVSRRKPCLTLSVPVTSTLTSATSLHGCVIEDCAPLPLAPGENPHFGWRLGAAPFLNALPWEPLVPSCWSSWLWFVGASVWLSEWRTSRRWWCSNSLFFDGLVSCCNVSSRVSVPLLDGSTPFEPGREGRGPLRQWTDCNRKSAVLFEADDGFSSICVVSSSSALFHRLDQRASRNVKTLAFAGYTTFHFFSVACILCGLCSCFPQHLVLFGRSGL